MSRFIPIGRGIRSQIEKFHPNIRDLVLYVNSQCNLRCRHCYIGNALLNKNNMFLTEDICSFVAEFDFLNRITVLGGEPLLHRGINRILQAVLACDIEERRVTTNLTDFFFLDRSRLVGTSIIFAVSLDGALSATHDEIRGAGSFKSTLKNIGILLNDKFDVEVTHTVTSANIGEFEGFVIMCKSLGIKKLNLHKISIQGNAAENQELGLSNARWVTFCQQLANMSRAEPDAEHSIKVRYPPMYTSQDEFTRMVSAGEYWPHSEGSYYTSDGGGRVVLYPNGRVYISSELFNTESYIGEIREGAFHSNEASSSEVNAPFKRDPLLLAKLGTSTSDGQDGDAILSVSFKRVAYI